MIKSQADHNGIRLMHIVIKMSSFTAMMPEEKSLVRGIVLINILSAHCSLQYFERTLYWCPTYLAQRDFWIVMDACLYKIVLESTIRMRMSEMGGNSYNPGCIFLRFIKQIVFIGVVIYETHLSTVSLYIITWVMGILLSYHFGNLFKIGVKKLIIGLEIGATTVHWIYRSRKSIWYRIILCSICIVYLRERLIFFSRKWTLIKRKIV